MTALALLTIDITLTPGHVSSGFLLQRMNQKQSQNTGLWERLWDERDWRDNGRKSADRRPFRIFSSSLHPWSPNA